MELLLQNGWPKDCIGPYFQPGCLSDIPTMADLGYAMSRIRTLVQALLNEVKIKRLSKDDWKHDKCFACTKLGKEKENLEPMR